MPLSPEELQAARLESMIAESRVPPEPKRESRLRLVEPTKEPPKEAPTPRHVTERPYLEKNKRYKRWSLK